MKTLTVIEPCQVCGNPKELQFDGNPEKFNKFHYRRMATLDGPGARTAGERADRAQSALDAYIGDDTPDESHIRDCISDLLHIAHRMGMDPVYQAEMGIGCWREESHNEL